MSDAVAKLAEIDRNLAVFQQLLPDLVLQHPDEYVLMRHGEVLDYFPEAIDAQIAGNQRFPDLMFSIQRITDLPEQLGCFSHAVDPRSA